jgi:DNA primase
MAQPGDFAYQVKQAADIVRVIGEQVRLKKGSGSRYMGLCPFHEEKTPSFSVHGGMQFYHCFGCGASGDVFKFVMETERLTFPEAVRALAQRFGIPIPRQRGPEADAEARLRAALYDLHELAATLFQRELRSAEGRQALDYLLGRGVLDDMIAEFRLGYAPAGGSALLHELEGKFTTEALEASGLVLKRDSGGHFDRFRNRLMFPICDSSGKVIAFGGRALSDQDQPKYLNSAETPIYRKSRVLFNFHRARETMRREQRVVLVEGYMDAMAVFAAGVKNVVASCGTSLALLQVKALSPMVKTVVVNYDPDSAGAAATERSLEMLLEEDLSVRVLSLPGGLDPDAFIKSNGSEAYAALLGEAPSFFDFLLERARGRFDCSSAAGRADAARLLLGYINKLPDAVERAELAKDLADRLGLDRNIVGQEMAAAAAGRKPWTPVLAADLLPYERELLRFVLEEHEARHAFLQAMQSSRGWEQWASRSIFSALIHMDLPQGSPLDVTALMDRLEPADRARLATLASQEGVELIPPERAHQYLAELNRLAELRQLREAKRRELATMAEAGPEQARAKAAIFMEIKKIEAELNASHLFPREPPAASHIP